MRTAKAGRAWSPLLARRPRRLPESWFISPSGRRSMTQAIQDQAKVVTEFPTANGAFRAARIAFVHGLWHRDIVVQAHAGFLDELARLGVPAEAVERFETPGAFE